MAIRYREKFNTYQVYWKNPYTKKIESKTFKTKKEAEKENSLILHRLKYEPESFKSQEDTQTGKAVAKTLFEVYNEMVEEKTIETHVYKTIFNTMDTKLKNKPISIITTKDIEDYKKTLFTRNYRAYIYIQPIESFSRNR